MGKKRAILAIVSLLLMIVASAVLAETFLLRSNSLHNNGRWNSTKTKLEMKTLAPFLCFNRGQALARGHLDLSAWHGFQEIWFHETLDVESVSFNFRLAPQAYLSFLTGSEDGVSSGIRLSSWPTLPSVLFSTRDTGEFTSETRLEIPPLENDQWIHVELAQSTAGLALTVNGSRVEVPANPPLLMNGIGFRGGFYKVLVDNIVITERGTGRVITERFWNIHHQGLVFLASLALMVMINVAIAALSVRAKGGRHAIPTWLAATNSNVLVLATLFFAYSYVTQEEYPNLLFNDPRAVVWRNRDIEEVCTRIREQCPTPPPEDVRRILVIGTSQTQGSGALRKEETYTDQLQALLARSFPDGPRIECLRAGVSAGNSSVLLDLYEREWLNVHPWLVVINLSNNDGDPTEFATNLNHFVDLNESASIKTLFALEPNTIETAPDELRLHPTMRKVAEERGVPIVDLHAYLKDNYDKGFLWWDFVHPTSFGHKLIAEGLERAIREQRLL